MESQTSPMNHLGENPLKLDLKTLLAALVEREVTRGAGQLTIVHSSAGWQVKLGRLDLSTRLEIEALPVSASLYEAMLKELATHR